MRAIPPKEIGLDHELRVWKLRQEFKTYKQIGEELGLSEKWVSLLMKRVTTRFVKFHMENINAFKAEQIAQIDVLIAECWRAWLDSKEKGQTSTTTLAHAQKLLTQDDITIGKEIPIQTTKHKGQGDVRFLTEMRKLMEEKRKVMGVDILRFKGETVGFNKNENTNRTETFKIRLNIPNANKLAQNTDVVVGGEDTPKDE